LPVGPTRFAITIECMPMLEPMSKATWPGLSMRLSSFEISGRKWP
jgi:hypothetical protein